MTVTDCLLTQHLKEVLATVVFTPPILQVHERWDGGLHFPSVDSRAKFTLESPLISQITSYVTVDIINADGKKEMNYNLTLMRSSCWQTMFDAVEKVLVKYSNTQNTKLTKVYRWYARNMVEIMRKNTEYANKMYALFLYIHANAGILPNVAEGIITALTILMNKYDRLASFKM